MLNWRRTAYGGEPRLLAIPRRSSVSRSAPASLRVVAPATAGLLTAPRSRAKSASKRWEASLAVSLPCLKALVLRLHLKGLSSFRASNGKATVDAAVSSQDVKVRLWKDGKEDSPLDAKSPFWMEIRMVGGDGKPAKVVPLKDGYFEMELPTAFFEGNPKAITVNWIDFYRN